jgi:nicotinate phosphoribosyltransferase
LTDTFGTRDFLKAFKKPINPNDSRTFADVFIGVRQDSGDPMEYAKLMRKFYDEQNIKTKQIVYSDSLDVEKCIKYKEETEKLNLTASFGVGTFLTSTCASKSNTDIS